MEQKNSMHMFSRVGATIAVLLFLCTPSAARAAEVINLFSSDITIHKDSTITVVETIDYDFGSTTPKHGIFRFIPTVHPEKASAWYTERYIDVHFDGVTRDAVTEFFVVTNEKGKVNVKIGNPDITMTGRHVYQITYTLQGALSYPPQLPPELYWNVNGSEWTVPIVRVQATLHDDGLLSNQRSCYKGHPGESTSCTIRTIDNAVTFEAALVSPGEEMTIANSLKENVVAKVSLERLKINWKLVTYIVVPLIVLLGLCVYVYRYNTLYKKDTPVIAEYEPYPGILPMYTGVVIDGKLDSKDMAAGIVYLADQGYIKIKNLDIKLPFDKNDYEITLLKVPPDNNQSKRDILSLLFPVLNTNTVSKFSELQDNEGKLHANAKIIEKLKEKFTKQLETQGYYEINKNKPKNLSFYLAVFLFGVFLFGGVTSLVFWIAGAIVLLCLILVESISRRRTTKGYEIQNYLQGFKLFLSVTEKDRLDFHNAPEKSPEQFLTFLPYAIAFGVENKWAKIFENITIPTPAWYDGGTAGAFSAVNFSTHLEGFSSAIVSASNNITNGNGGIGGGGGGSGGGGFSGGGGGGGGGGSW